MKLSRRDLLKNAALFAALSPVIGQPSRTAAIPARPRRVVIVFSPNGPIYARGPAVGSEREFSLHDWWSPLERHRDVGNFFGGLYQAGIPYSGTYLQDRDTGHQAGSTGCLTARGLEGTDNGTGPSLDQFIGQELQASGVVTPRRSLLWGWGSGFNWGPWFEGPGAFLSPNPNPYAALETLAPALGASGMEERARVEAVLRRKHFILDQVAGDCRDIARTLGSEARERLDFHCSNIESLEASVAASLAMPAAECRAPDRLMGTIGPDSNFDSEENRDEVMRAFTDLMGLAFACDLTRVIGVSFGVSAQRFGIPSSYGIPSSNVVDSSDSGPQHHAWTHNDSGETSLVALRGFYHWYSEQVGRIVDMLKTTLDADGRPLIESTLVLWTSELGHTTYRPTGGSSPGHPISDIPILLFGDSEGELATNRFYEGDGSEPTAAVIHGLFVSILHHMGLTHLSAFGNHETGPLEWLRG
jgi:hypothetical protein